MEIEEIAYRVINGEYGNGDERKKRLREEGYNYALVQNEVNKILGYSKRHNPLDYIWRNNWFNLYR